MEAIDDATLQNIATQQSALTKAKVHGQFITVPVLEGGVMRGGRFGWKNQHASLLVIRSRRLSQRAGITSRLNPIDTTQLCKTTTDPEDVDNDIDEFATFIRGT